jgi:hypothetical protein
VRGLAEWGRETWRTGTDRRVPLFRPTKFAFASSVTVQLILAAKRAFPISTNCLSAVRVVGLLNNPRMEPERRAMCSRQGTAYPSPCKHCIGDQTSSGSMPIRSLTATRNFWCSPSIVPSSGSRHVRAGTESDRVRPPAR